MHRRDILTALESEREFKFTWKTLVHDDSGLNVTWRLWLGVLTQFFQQMNGMYKCPADSSSRARVGNDS
jgi:hypothetical protein